MFQKEKPWHEARREFCDSNNELVLCHYVKNKCGYFLNAFFGKFFCKTLLFCFVGGLLLLFNFFAFKTDVSERMEFNYVILSLMGLMLLFWLIYVIVHIWFWKYTKDVIITDQGIWVMERSSFWWSNAWNGKKYLCSAYWSFYAWEELSGVDEKQSGISKICKLKDFVMDRWDGQHEVQFLKPNEVEEIVSLSKKYIKPRKRKKKSPPKQKLDWTKWFKDFFKRK